MNSLFKFRFTIISERHHRRGRVMVESNRRKIIANDIEVWKSKKEAFAQQWVLEQAL